LNASNEAFDALRLLRAAVSTGNHTYSLGKFHQIVKGERRDFLSNNSAENRDAAIGIDRAHQWVLSNVKR